MSEEIDIHAVALAELQALVKVPGSLRIITGEHACGGGLHPDVRDRESGARLPFDTEACAAFEHGLVDGRHFVWHNVVEVEGPDDRGNVTVRSEEGDFTYGKPADVLARSSEWKKYREE